MSKKVMKRLGQDLLALLGVFLLLLVSIPMACWVLYRKARGLPIFDANDLEEQLAEYRKKGKKGERRA